MDESHGVESAFRELGADGFGIDGMAPLGLDGFCLEAAFLGDVEPLV